MPTIDSEQPRPRFQTASTPAEPGAAGLALDELNCTCVTLPAGGAVSASADRETAIVCTAGSGSAVIGAGEHATTESLEPGDTILFAADTQRQLIAGDNGLSFVTVHRRRGPLQLGGTGAPA